MKNSKEKKPDREWLVKTIAQYGGPSNCPDDFVMSDTLLMMVNAQAAFDFQGVMTTDNDVTVTDYLERLKRHFPE